MTGPSTPRDGPQVRRKRFYHVNRSLDYDGSPRLSPGQRLHVGTEENSFTRYYRKRTLTYPVDYSDGTRRCVPAIEYLTGLRDGTIKDNELPRVAHVGHAAAGHFMLLARELLWESIRLSEFPCLPSRQRAMWLVRDIDGLKLWRRRLRAGEDCGFLLAEVEATGVVHECDASLLMHDSECLGLSESKARAYWRGDFALEGAEPEILFVGDLEVIRILDPSEVPEE